MCRSDASAARAEALRTRKKRTELRSSAARLGLEMMWLSTMLLKKAAHLRMWLLESVADPTSVTVPLLSSAWTHLRFADFVVAVVARLKFANEPISLEQTFAQTFVSSLRSLHLELQSPLELHLADAGRCRRLSD